MSSVRKPREGVYWGNMILDRRGHQPREVVDSENLIRRFVLFGFRMMASFNQLHRWGAVVSSPSLVCLSTRRISRVHTCSRAMDRIFVLRF